MSLASRIGMALYGVKRCFTQTVVGGSVVVWGVMARCAGYVCLTQRVRGLVQLGS